MRLGISSYSYSWACRSAQVQDNPMPMTPLVLAKQAVRHGISLLQFGDNLPLHMQREEELEKLQKYCVEHKIDVEMGTTGIDADSILQYAKLGARFGSKTIRTLLPEGMEINDLLIELKRLIPILKDYQVVLAIENYECFNCMAYQELFNGLPEIHFKFCLDTANNLGTGESVWDFLECMAPHLLCLHIKDIVVKRIETRMGFVVTGAKVGDGILDVPSLLRRVKLTCPDCWVILEQWPPYVSNLQQTLQIEENWVEDGVRFLKKCIKNTE